MVLNIDGKFKGKLTCAFKSDMSDLASFRQSIFKSLKIGTLMGPFYPKKKTFELKIYRGVMCHDYKKWCKIWREIVFSLQNWHEEFEEFWPKQWTISKFCNLMGYFWPKYITFELKKSIVDFCLIALKLMQNLKENWLVLSKMTWRIWQIFIYRLKNSDFILESKMTELNQNQNSKRPYRPDTVWKLYFTLKINE